MESFPLDEEEPVKIVNAPLTGEDLMRAARRTGYTREGGGGRGRGQGRRR
jgi:hypothetical protein